MSNINDPESWDYSDAELEAINQELEPFSIQQRGPIRENLWAPDEPDPQPDPPKKVSFGRFKDQARSRHNFGRQDIVPAGLYPARIADSQLVEDRWGDLDWVLWFKLRDHRVVIKQDFNASGPRIAQLQVALNFRLEDIGDEDYSTFIGRTCRVELKVNSYAPRYKIVRVLPEEVQP